MQPRIISVNVSRSRPLTWRGRSVSSAIGKEPVEGPVRADGVNLAGDDQADRRVHGGRDKAVYAYAAEDYAWWADELGRLLPPGIFGENLTTTGIDLNECAIGDRWRIGDAVFEVSQPREPCFKLGMQMGDAAFREDFDKARRPGAYLRIVEPGFVTAGDPVAVTAAARPAIRIAELTGDIEPEVLRRIVTDDRVPVGWRRGAARALEFLDID